MHITLLTAFVLEYYTKEKKGGGGGIVPHYIFRLY